MHRTPFSSLGWALAIWLFVLTAPEALSQRGGSEAKVIRKFGEFEYRRFDPVAQWMTLNWNQNDGTYVLAFQKTRKNAQGPIHGEMTEPRVVRLLSESKGTSSWYEVHTKSSSPSFLRTRNWKHRDQKGKATFPYRLKKPAILTIWVDL